MHIESILRRLQPQPGFVYAKVRLTGDGPHAEVHVHLRPGRGSRAVCSSCMRKRPGYDVLDTRWFSFVPLWGLPVFFAYAMRRVDCGRCGVTVEAVPWATGKMQATHGLRNVVPDAGSVADVGGSPGGGGRIALGVSGSALGAGDVAGFLQMYDDDALHEFPVAPEGRPERLEGKAAIAKHVKILPSVVLFESFDARVREAGDKLIVETNADGRLPPTGAPCYMQYV